MATSSRPGASSLRQFQLHGVSDTGRIIGNGSYAAVKELEFRGLKCRVQSLTTENQDKQSQIESLTIQAQSQIESLTAQVQDKQSQIESLTAQNQEKQSQIESLTAQNQAEHSEIEALRAEVEQLSMRSPPKALGLSSERPLPPQNSLHMNLQSKVK